MISAKIICSNLAEALKLVCICMPILQAFETVFLYVWITCICLCICMACTFQQLCSLVADTQACPSAAPTGGLTILSTTIPTLNDSYYYYSYSEWSLVLLFLLWVILSTTIPTHSNLVLLFPLWVILSTTIPTQLTPTTVALIKPGTVHSCPCFRPTHTDASTRIHKYKDTHIPFCCHCAMSVGISEVRVVTTIIKLVWEVQKSSFSPNEITEYFYWLSEQGDMTGSSAM